jgi:stage VI sporulation protein D
MSSTNPNQEGIRLDLYERIQLDADAADIHRLDEVELIPNLTVVEQDDAATISGHFLLRGAYVHDEQLHDFEQTIPISLTIPSASLRETSADILVEQFDVEISPPRALDLTGVLAIPGVQLSAFAQVQSEHAHPHPVPEPLPTPPLPPTPPAPPLQPLPPTPPAPPLPPAPVPTPVPEVVDIELTRQLIRVETDVRPSYTMKCCIVQRQDTWADICNRYNKTIREIRLFNRFDDQVELAEGLIVFIP